MGATGPAKAVAYTKAELEAFEESRLAVYAARASASTRRRRIPPERDGHDYRTEFQRDRDRIVHSKAFRRLKHKTQVFIPFEGDHYRTRLTHTLEVTQVARTVARTLGLNEDLAEACALAHDLGHTPFGHSGEKALNRILTGGEPAVALSPKAVALVGAFKHNYQSVRVVDLLETRYEAPGLNLTDETREGILKHTTWKREFPFPVLDPAGLRLGSGCHLEGQAVGWADEIAQQAHDLEDGLGLVGIDRVVQEVPVAKEVVGSLGAAWREAAEPSVKRALLIRGLIHALVTDLVVASRASLERWLTARRVATPAEFAAQRRKLPGSLVAPSRDGERRYLELKEFVYRHIIHSQAVSQHDARAQLVVNRLFDAYAKNPRLLPDAVLRRVADLSGLPFLREVPLKKVDAVIAGRWREEPVVLRCIADHLAGMTDSYALAEYDALFAPYPRRPAGTPAG